MSLLHELEATINNRKSGDPDGSWTAKLLSEGPDKCAEKFGEEAIEAIVAAAKGDTDNLRDEAADVLYHLLVMLASRNVSLDAVFDTLKARQSQSGIAEKASRT